MVAFTKKFSKGLVLSLSISSTLFLSSNAQSTTTTTSAVAPKPTAVVDAPTAFLGVASAATKSNIYYHGGQLNQITRGFSGELYSLDITKSWFISTPAWTNITIPKSGSTYPPVVGQQSATISPDGSSLWVTAPTGTSDPFLYEYSISSGSWSTVAAPSAQATAWSNRKNAYFLTDSSVSWLLGGSFADGSITGELDKFDGTTWTPNIALNPGVGVASNAIPSSFNMGTAHLYNNKIYVFGGFGTPSGSRVFQSFQSLPYVDVSTSTFGVQLTLGNVPPPRQAHCSVLTASKKIIIFGGLDAATKLTVNDMWSLDLITWTWSQVVPASPPLARHGHNCDIIGANIVVFGGASTVNNTGFGKDVQVYDVVASAWVDRYSPKQDNTPISAAPNGSGGASNSGMSTGAIIGIVIGALAIIGAGVGVFIYKRRQKRLEIHEAEMEKEAYLASLRPEGGDGRQGQNGAAILPGSTSVISTPGMTHSGAFSGMDELLLSNAAASPSISGQGQGNVQYLMQHLPDGTIAVQPVYVDHHAIQSPNIGGDDQGYISPNMNGGNSSYFSPPPQTSQAYGQQVTYPQQSYDPFASPAVPSVPLPPGYAGGGGSTGGNSAMGSPQHTNEQLRHH